MKKPKKRSYEINVYKGLFFKDDLMYKIIGIKNTHDLFNYVLSFLKDTAKHNCYIEIKNNLGKVIEGQLTWAFVKSLSDELLLKETVAEVH